MKKILFLLFILPHLVFAITGLKKGSSVPQISFKDIEGISVNLLKSKDPIVLVFFRGSWCPYCMKQLESIEKDLSDSVKTNLVAISVDNLSVAKKMKDKYKLNFQIVSDPKAKILKAFNIANKLDDKLVKKYKSSYKIDVERASGETHHLVAHPAVFVVKNGVISFVDVNVNYKVRTDNADILKALE